MNIVTRFPASFGELIQGNIKGRDSLISFPINLYTNVCLYEIKDPINKFKYKKSLDFMRNILNDWGYKKEEKFLDIQIKSEIPIGKGFSSSTSDLGALYLGLCRLFYKEFNTKELIRNCIKIEPTDSIIFNELTLFEYKTGKNYEMLGKYFNVFILVIEGEYPVDTLEFNKQKNKVPLAKLDNIIDGLKEAIINMDLKKIFTFSTESIIKNNSRLTYKNLQYIIRICRVTYGLGVVGAHSGNVLGIVYDSKNQCEGSLQYVKSLGIKKCYMVESLSNVILEE